MAEFKYGDIVEIDNSGVEYEVMWTAKKDAEGRQTKLRIRKRNRSPGSKHTMQVEVANVTKHTPAVPTPENVAMQKYMAQMEKVL